jgi:hypothetical protein
MGDGCINRGYKNSQNPRIQCEMISKDYLKYLDDIFGAIGCGVSLNCTAEESAEHCRESGFSPNASAENYSDLYVWRSRSHPELQEFAKWYNTGEKVWPSDISLTPTVLKHWYCGDGTYNNRKSQNHIIISCAKQYKNTEKIDGVFSRQGLPEPSNYNIYERDDGSVNCMLSFTVKDSQEIFSYMGGPLPGFEYKWP